MARQKIFWRVRLTLDTFYESDFPDEPTIREAWTVLLPRPEMGVPKTAADIEKSELKNWQLKINPRSNQRLTALADLVTVETAGEGAAA